MSSLQQSALRPGGADDTQQAAQMGCEALLLAGRGRGCALL